MLGPIKLFRGADVVQVMRVALNSRISAEMHLGAVASRITGLRPQGRASSHDGAQTSLLWRGLHKHEAPATVWVLGLRAGQSPTDEVPIGD
jgi:hypothetical protein